MIKNNSKGQFILLLEEGSDGIVPVSPDVFVDASQVIFTDMSGFLFTDKQEIQL